MKRQVTLRRVNDGLKIFYLDLRHLAARRQGAAPRGDGLDLSAQRDFVGKQRVSRLAVFGALVGIGEL